MEVWDQIQASVALSLQEPLSWSYQILVRGPKAHLDVVVKDSNQVSL